MARQSKNAQEDLKMFVVDVLRHDAVEQISSILRLLNNTGCIGWRDQWPHDFTAQEVESALAHLIQEGLVCPFRERTENDPNEANEDGFVAIPVVDFRFAGERDSLWFHLTRKGREAWSRWEPPGQS